MNKPLIVYAIIILCSVFIGAVSQVLLKKAALKTYPSVIKEYLNPLVIFAYILFLVTTVLTVIGYRGIPISMGPILEGTSYIYVTFFGVKIFKENLNRKKLIALFLIIIGIVIYSLGQ